MVSIQSSHTSLSKCKCSSPFGNLMSCSLLTPWLCSLICFSYGNVIYGVSCLYSLNCLSRGDVIYGTTRVYIIAYTTVGIALTTVGTIDGSILPFIIFCAFKFVLLCSLFTSEPKAFPSSTMFFLLKALLGEFVATFFMFSSVVYISSLLLLTFASGFRKLSF
jgi:hypothetical protein